MDPSEHYEPYIDPWQEYKQISAKLRKRFLKKPNVAEAIKDFGQLSRRLEEENCLNYAGFAKLSVARCENKIDNVAGETSSLKDAGRLFLQEEFASRRLCLTSFGANLNSAIHCYGHAIRLQLEHNELESAGKLSIELGEALFTLEKTHEAIEYFARAAQLFQEHPLHRIQAQKWLIASYVRTCQPTEAFRAVLDLEKTVRPVCDAAPRGEFGAYGKILRDCDILRLLLVLKLQLVTPSASICEPTPLPSSNSAPLPGSNSAPLPASNDRSEVIAAQNETLATFFVLPDAKSLDDPKSLSNLHHARLDADLFLNLQSIAFAVQTKCKRSFDASLAEIWTQLDGPQKEVAHSLTVLFR